MPSHDINELCEIAARLNDDAATLRGLGFGDAAQFLELAESEIDERVYASLQNGKNGSASAEPRRPAARGKSKEIRTH
jgi:hypothetical protein